MDSGGQLRGVNLGGWLVLERWMTPSLFEGTEAKDEYSLLELPGAKDKLERHRRSFISEEDFKWIAENGLNAVRIPIGYWVFDGDGPFTPCISYLDFAMDMAEKYHLKVLIDLHAAKGSQNGNDHSGRVGRADWYAHTAYRQETIDLLVLLAKRYENSPALWGIEMLNEPKIGPLRFFILRKFYHQAYERLLEAARPGTRIVFSDSFVPRLFSGTIRAGEEFPAVMDIHWYQFGRTNIQRYFAGFAKRPRSIESFERRQPVIIGEWSGMLSHLTLEGLLEETRGVLQREHITRQLEAYAGAAGWFYWTYKTEEAGIWNFRSLVERRAIHLT